MINQENPRARKKWTTPLVIVCLFVFAILAGFYIIGSRDTGNLNVDTIPQKETSTSKPSKTPTLPPATIDLNGLWKSSASANIIKIIQTGNSVVFTWYQVDPNSRWQEKVGDVSVQATLSGRKLTGQVKIITEKGYCTGTSWWQNYSANISEDGKTIQEAFQSVMYYHENCQKTGEYPQKSNTLTKIQ